MEREVFKKKLGKRIAKLRKENGLTQVQLAKTLNLPKQNINRLEAGEVNPSAHFVYEISKALKISLNELISF